MTAIENFIREAIGYGLDVEPERCDDDAVREAVLALRQMSDDERAAAVQRGNEGWPIRRKGKH